MEVLLDIDYYLFTLINKDISNTIFDAILPLLRNKYIWYPFYIIISSWFIVRNGALKGIIIIISLISCVVLADICSSQILKKYVRRVRPCNSVELLDLSVTRAKCRNSFSFPSSHATNHFAIAMFIILVGSISFYWRYLLWLWAGLVSFSQIYVGLHYPLDVIGGAILGVLLARVFFIFLKKIKVFHKEYENFT